MLSCIRRPTISYELPSLAGPEACVSVGRETDSAIQLDSPDIPCLLSRRHATLMQQPGGAFTIVDLGSTNGTFAARAGQALRKLQVGALWELQHGDTVGFGGPETIIVKREQVPNPFLFKFYAAEADQQEATLRRVSDSDQENTGTEGVMEVDGGEGAKAALSEQQALQRPCRPTALQARNTPLAAAKQHAHAPAIACKGETAPSGAQVLDMLSGHLSCPVCCDWLVASHTLPCGHMFCGPCLATWMNQSSSCPSCRKAINSLPVRCFQVDAAVSEVLAMQTQQPAARIERKRKQEHWDNVQRHIVQDWATGLQKRRDAAVAQAARHNLEIQSGGDPSGTDTVIAATGVMAHHHAPPVAPPMLVGAMPVMPSARHHHHHSHSHHRPSPLAPVQQAQPPSLQPRPSMR